MKQETTISEKKYRAECKDCESGSRSPVSKRFAEFQAESHEDATGHDVTVVPVEDDRADDPDRTPILDAWRNA